MNILQIFWGKSADWNKKKVFQNWSEVTAMVWCSRFVMWRQERLYCSHLTHLTLRRNRLGRFGVPKSAAFTTGVADLIWENSISSQVLNCRVWHPQFKPSCGHWNLWSIKISSATPSQFQTWLVVEVSQLSSKLIK